MRLSQFLQVLTLALLTEHLTYLKAVSFYEDGVEVKGALWPDWQVWDEEEYTVMRLFAAQTEVAFAFVYFDFYGIANFVYFTQYQGQLNSGPWTTLRPGPITPISLLGSLQVGNNSLHLQATDYLGNVRLYAFQLWLDTPDQVLVGYTWSGEAGKFECGLAAGKEMDYVCGPETNGNDLGVMAETDSGNQIVARHVSMLSRSEEWRELGSSLNTTFLDFFSSTGDHFLELLVRSQSQPRIQRLYRFRFTKTAANCQVHNTTLWLNTSANLQSWDNYFQLKPRPHPEVTTYTAIGKMMEVWNYMLMIGLSTWQPCALHIYRPNLTTGYVAVSTPVNFFLSLSAGLNLVSVVPPSAPGLSVAYYLEKMDDRYAATRIRLYWNPLVDMQDGRNYSSNCSALPLGYSYAYPASKLRSYSAIKAAEPNLTLITELNQSRLAISGQMTLPSIPFQPNAGILFLIDTSSDHVSAHINFFQQPRDTLYLTGNKSFYPVRPGATNQLVSRVVAEDWSGQLSWNMHLYIQSNETGVGSVEVGEPAWVEEGGFRLGSWDQAFNVNISAKDARAVILIVTDGEAYTGSNASSVISGRISLPQGLLPSSFSLRFTILAESRNIQKDHIYSISRVDVCGDGARWAGLEKCDTGSGQKQGSGCWNCEVETGWRCSGGSALSPDVCVRLPSQQDGNVPSGNTGSTAGTNGNNDTETNNPQGTEPQNIPNNDTTPNSQPNNTSNDPQPNTHPSSIPNNTETVNTVSSIANSTAEKWILPFIDVSFLLLSSMSLLSFATSASLHSFLLSPFLHSPVTTIVSLLSQLQLLAFWGETASPPPLLHTILTDFHWTLFRPSRLLPSTGRRLSDMPDILEGTGYIWILLAALLTVHILCWTLHKGLKSRITAALVHFMTFSAYIYWYLGVYTGLAVAWVQYSWELEADPLSLSLYSGLCLLVLAGPFALVLFLCLNRLHLPSISFRSRYGALYECIRLQTPLPPYPISPGDPSPGVIYINSQAPRAFHALRKAPDLLKEEEQLEEAEMHRSYVVQPTSPELPRPLFYSTPMDGHKRNKANPAAVPSFEVPAEQSPSLSICFFPLSSLFPAFSIVLLLGCGQLLPACLLGSAFNCLFLAYLMVYRPVEGKRYFLLHCLKSLLMALCWLCFLLVYLTNQPVLDLFAVVLIAILVLIYLFVFLVEQLSLLKALFQRQRLSIAPLTATELPVLQLWKCEKGLPDITSTDRQTRAKTDQGATERPDLSAI